MVPLSPNALIEHMYVAQRLTESHLPSLLQQLSDHATRWRDIGTYFGFTSGKLDNIQYEHPSPTTCLSKMLTEWLQWAPGDSRGSTNFATLEALKDALNQVGLAAAAHDLHA